MKIASGQIESKVGDIKENFIKHMEMINIAIKNHVDLIVFPEMSLTGYCREEGFDLRISKTDQEIIHLQEIAKENEITIIVGAPIDIKNELFIGSYIFNASGEIDIYTKQYLHEGEELYYSSSFDYNPQIKIEDEIISLAICADINDSKHPSCAKENQCTLYIPSIFYSRNGIEEGHNILSKYAKKHSFHILMSNFHGKTWGMEAGGKSGFWSNTGILLASLDSEKEGLLIIEKTGAHWTHKKTHYEMQSHIN